MDDKNKSMLLHIRPVEVEECGHSHGENHRDDAVDALAYCTHDIQSVRHCGHSRHYREIIQNNNYNQVNQKQLKLNIRKVIFNDPATIVFWLDGTKTIVKKADDEPWDPEKGLAMAIIKKYFGTNKEIKKIILALEK